MSLRRGYTAKTKNIGTTGYPGARYGRRFISGLFIRNTITDAAVIPYKIQLGKITRGRQLY